MRKAGLCGKLEASWEGPYVVERKNSPLSYSVNVGDRTIPSVHISLLKSYKKENEVDTISRATTVMNEDVVGDEIGERYSEVKVSGEEKLDVGQREQIEGILGKFRNTLTKEPGLTDITSFRIDTGDNTPIYQRPYSTPAHFRQSIDKEIDWLLEKDFIRPSSSP